MVKKIIIFLLIVIAIVVITMLNKSNNKKVKKANNRKTNTIKNEKKTPVKDVALVEERTSSKKKEVEIDPMLKAILDTVAPISVSFDQNSFRFGDKIVRAYAITQYTPHPKFGWLADIMGIPNTIVSTLYTPTSNADLMQALAKTLNVMRGTAESTRNYIEQQRVEQGIENAEETIKRLDRTGESVGRFSCIVLAFGTSKEEFQKSCSRVESKISALNLRVKILSNLQKEGFMSAFPTYTPQADVLRCSEKIITQSAMEFGMPIASSAFSDDTGCHFAEDTNGNMIILDMWKRIGDRTNSNFTVMGMPGKGKSFSVKSILLGEWMRGTRIYIIDPEREYVQMVEDEMEGEVLKVGANSKGSMINPLQIRTVSSSSKDEKNPDEEDTANLASHLKTVETFFDLYLEDITASQKALLKDMTIKAYAKYGITFESDIYHLTNNDYPVMKDIYDLIEFEITKLDMKKKRGENVSTVEYNDYVQLRGLMKDIAVGGDSFIWNGETTIHSDSKVVALDTSGFAEGNEKLKKIQYFNVLTWVWEQASQNREERCIIVADEAYMMIDQRVPTALIHMRNMAKRGRKYNVSIMTISHSVVDFLAPAIKQYGQELIGTSCYKMFFGCEGQNLLELSNLYDLKEAERDFLLGAEQGYALAQFGSKRVIVHFKVGDYKKRRISGGGEGVETKKKNTSNRNNVVWQSVNA